MQSVTTWDWKKKKTDIGKLGFYALYVYEVQMSV